jgi:predicted porin
MKKLFAFAVAVVFAGGVAFAQAPATDTKKDDTKKEDTKKTDAKADTKKTDAKKTDAKKTDAKKDPKAEATPKPEEKK